MGRKKKEDKDEEFMRDQALADTARGGSPLPEDYVYSLGRSVYMIMDPEVSEMLKDDGNPQLKSLIPAFSHLNRTTAIGEKEARLLLLQYEYIGLIHTLNMDEDEYENKGWALLEALEIFARNIVADARHGWKGRLVTEQIKIIKTEIEKKKKGGIF